jgi:hypothetical protein
MGNLAPGMPRSLSKGAKPCRFADHPTKPVTPVHRLVAIPVKGGRDQSERLVGLCHVKSSARLVVVASQLTYVIIQYVAQADSAVASP